MGQLPEAVRKGGTQAADVLGAGLFEYLAGQPEEAAQFAASMEALTGSLAADAARVIDASGVSLAVDVGGGTGQLVRELMRANDGLHGLVLDLRRPPRRHGRRRRRTASATRFSAVAGDFFAAVPGADLYLLKAVLHDWDDDSCVRILRNCRAAARPGARLIVIENVIRDLARDRFATLLDMNMLAVTTGQERDLAGYDALSPLRLSRARGPAAAVPPSYIRRRKPGTRGYRQPDSGTVPGRGYGWSDLVRRRAATRSAADEIMECYEISRHGFGGREHLRVAARRSWRAAARRPWRG